MATALASTSFAGAAVAQRRSVAPSRAPRSSTVVCHAVDRRQQLLGLAAGVLVTVSTSLPAQAGLVDDLLAKSGANKALHDKQRLAASYANLARSRTVADGSCAFPNNFVGCGGAVQPTPNKFIKQDLALQCEGQEAAKCNSSMQAFFIPKAFNK